MNYTDEELREFMLVADTMFDVRTSMSWTDTLNTLTKKLGIPRETSSSIIEVMIDDRYLMRYKTNRGSRVLRTRRLA